MTGRGTDTQVVGGPFSATLISRFARTTAAIPSWLAAVILAVLLGAAWIAVYRTGGTQRAYTHLFYVPVIGSVVPFRWWGALTTSLTATVVCGPLMPLDSVTGESQQLSSWLFRGLMFLIIGTFAHVAIALHTQVAQQAFSSEVQRAIAQTAQPGRSVDEALVPLVADVVAQRRFHVVYQPVYSLTDGALLAVEALSRFDAEPRRTPDLWFAAAAAAGIGADLEIAAIAAAVAGLDDLPPHVALSVNASPATLGDPRLLDVIRGCPRQLVVEITEHDVIEDYYVLQHTVRAMRELGVRIAVDDAGAGISSLRHIVQLAPEVIKLDISLTQGVGTSTLRRALAGALIDFARRSDAQLIVEGIEEINDLAIWTTLGADAVQGYLVGRPGPLPVALQSGVIASIRGARV